MLIENHAKMNDNCPFIYGKTDAHSPTTLLSAYAIVLHGTANLWRFQTAFNAEKQSPVWRPYRLEDTSIVPRFHKKSQSFAEYFFDEGKFQAGDGGL